jgi:hypothetical protein
MRGTVFHHDHTMNISDTPDRLYHLQVEIPHIFHILIITPLLQCIWKQQLMLSMEESRRDYNDNSDLFTYDTNIIVYLFTTSLISNI